MAGMGIEMAWYDSAVFYHIHPLSLCGQIGGEAGGAYFGKLAGWAEHAKKMGCNAVYIGPVFQTEAQGRGTVDYYKVDQRLGLNEDFKEWVAQCHRIGMRVVVEGSFNHVGRDFFAFWHLRQNKAKSAYKEWFSNVDFNSDNEYGDGFRYEGWGGYHQFVRLNLQNPWLNDYQFDIVRYWIREFDIDGICLGAVEEEDYDFIKILRKAVQKEKTGFLLMGEPADGDYGYWANDRLLHLVVDHEMHNALVSAHNGSGYPVIAHAVKRRMELCPGKKLYTYVDNYDGLRIYEKLNRPEHRYLVTLLLYTLSGIPSVFCGSEFCLGMKKKRDADGGRRQVMELEDYSHAYLQDEITYLHCLLGRASQQFMELAKGRYKELLLTDGQYAFARVLGKAAMVTVLNNEDRLIRVEIPLPFPAGRAVDILEAAVDWEKGFIESLDISGCRQFAVKDNELHLDLPANGGMLIWVVA